MRVFLTVLSVLILLVLSGCGNNDTGKKLYSHGARNLDEADAIFVRIEASYEVIETGEVIEFDYVVSCYNRDLVGSFSPVETSRNIFKATSHGAALSINHPGGYCTGRPFDEPGRYDYAPVIGWFDDVNDLSFGIFYMTNDAYNSPRAKIKFLDYKPTRTDRESFNAWAKKAEAEYVQIGALPGPFGCRNSGNASLEDNCLHKSRIDRNNGLRIATLGSKMATAIQGPDDLGESFREYLQDYRNVDAINDHDHLCGNGVINPKTGEPSIGERDVSFDLRDYNKENFSHIPNYNWDKSIPVDQQWPHKRAADILKGMTYTKWRIGKTHLDLEGLKTGTPTYPVMPIYPVIFYRHPINDGKDDKEWSTLTYHEQERTIVQFLWDPSWRGFAIWGGGASASRDEFISRNGFERPDYKGDYGHAVYINDTLVCENKWKRTWNIVDLNNNVRFYVR